MLIANDEYGNRVHASIAIYYENFYCPICNEKLTLKKGTFIRPYFSHKAKSNCVYGKNKDCKSEWHIRMQELFAPDSMEIRFKDKKTGEEHIADVFMKETQTVIEFQKSAISLEEFVRRTMFHISEGRRIVWIFDESKDNEMYGRFRKNELWGDWIHRDYSFDWPRSPRKVLRSITSSVPLDQNTQYSICAYMGEEPNTVHRIIDGGYDYSSVVFSVNAIVLDGKMDMDVFFRPESYWLKQSPWVEIIREREKVYKHSSSRGVGFSPQIQRPRRRRL